MEQIKLQLPKIYHKEAAEDYKNEFFQYNEFVINGSALFDQMKYEQWLVNTTNNSKENTVRADWVVASTFFAVRQCDSKIIGMIDIRHTINNDFLKHYGGHIGYSVRPSERKKGYATAMVRLGLNYAKTLGLNKVMLGCYADNVPSIQTIKKCGGILTEIKPYLDGKSIHIYWIDLQQFH